MKGLSQPYNIYISLGPIPTDPKTWNTHPNTIGLVAVLSQGTNTGCEKCTADIDGRLCITAMVPLTEALMEYLKDKRKSLTELDDDSVEGCLRENLHWRVILKNRTEVAKEEVSALKVVVPAAAIRLDENGVPVYEAEPKVFVDVTRGWPAGCGSVGEV
ncbi:hypothetical protein OQA88_11528 [Cercophora sp. LCS_1]